MSIMRNAIIESARLTTEDYDVLSMWLTLDYGGTCQGFGGYTLCVSPDSPHYLKDRMNYAGVFIRRVFDVAGVTSFDKLKGRTIRVRLDGDGLAGKIEAIGHIVKDDWFNPKKVFEAGQELAA